MKTSKEKIETAIGYGVIGGLSVSFLVVEGPLKFAAAIAFLTVIAFCGIVVGILIEVVILILASLLDWWKSSNA